MNWVSLFFAGLGGAIGGVLGVLLAGVIGKLFKLDNKSQIRTGILVVFVVGSINILPPVLDRYFGEYARGVLPAPDYYAKLEADPFWQRIFRDNPELVPIVQDRIDIAYRQGGKEAVAKAVFDFGYEIGATYVVKYMSRAHEDHIPKMIEYYVSSLDSMRKLERPLCYYWFFNSSAMSAGELKQVGSIAGDGSLFKTLIETAYDDVPQFNQAQAEELQNLSIARIQSKYGEEATTYLSGSVVPESIDQEAMYCSIYYDLYKFMQDLEPANQITHFRYVFSSAGS